MVVIKFRVHQLSQCTHSHFRVRRMIFDAMQGHVAVTDGEGIVGSGCVAIEWLGGIVACSTARTVGKLVTDPFVRSLRFLITKPSALD